MDIEKRIMKEKKKRDKEKEKEREYREKEKQNRTPKTFVVVSIAFMLVNRIYHLKILFTIYIPTIKPTNLYLL